MAEMPQTAEDAATAPAPTEKDTPVQTPSSAATRTPRATAPEPTTPAATASATPEPVETAEATQAPVATREAETPTVEPTATPATDATPALVDAPTLTPMPTETMPAGIASASTLPGVPVQVKRNANLRSGPGTQYSIIGHARAGETLMAVGKNEDSSWLALDTNAWIAAFLVTGPVEELAVVPVEPATTPTTKGGIVDISAAQGYAAEVLVHINNYTGTLGTLESLSSNVEATPELMSDKNWREEVLVNFATILSTNHLIRGMNPPAELADMHNNLLEMTNSYEKAMMYFTIGIESGDPNLVTAGIAELEAGKSVMNTAATILAGLFE